MSAIEPKPILTGDTKPNAEPSTPVKDEPHPNAEQFEYLNNQPLSAYMACDDSPFEHYQPGECPNFPNSYQSYWCEGGRKRRGYRSGGNPDEPDDLCMGDCRGRSLVVHLPDSTGKNLAILRPRNKKGKIKHPTWCTKRARLAGVCASVERHVHGRSPEPPEWWKRGVHYSTGKYDRQSYNHQVAVPRGNGDTQRIHTKWIPTTNKARRITDPFFKGLTPYYTPRIPKLFGHSHHILIGCALNGDPTPIPEGRRLIVTEIKTGLVVTSQSIMETIVERHLPGMEKLKRHIDVVMRAHCADGLVVDIQWLWDGVCAAARKENKYLRESYIPHLVAALIWSFVDDMSNLCKIQPDDIPRYCFLRLPETGLIADSLELQTMSILEGVVFLLPNSNEWVKRYLTNGLKRERCLYHLGINPSPRGAPLGMEDDELFSEYGTWGKDDRLKGQRTNEK